MQNTQSFYPASPYKELDKFTFTETHTHTNHIPSNFDHVHDEVTTEEIQVNQRFGNQLGKPNQKSLTKVRSMPQTQFTQYRLQQARGSVQQNFRKTDFNNAVQNTELNNFSPVPNRGKAHELNQTLNTNVQSRQFVGQGTMPIEMPKMIQKSTSGFLPQLQGYDSLQQDVRPATNFLSQESEVPVSNQRVSFQTNSVIPHIIRGQENVPRTSSMSIVNRPSVSSSFNVLQSNVVPLQSRNVPLDSRNVQKTLLTAAETRRQYQSILIDQQGNQLPSHQQKFSFISDTVQSPRLTTVQDYQQVQIQRPNYRKIYHEKGEYYRTVGPQKDYYKQEVTCCLKLLPALGVLALILLVAGTLVGIGVLTGLIGGNNYLARAEGNSLNRVSGGNRESGMVINEMEDGKVSPPIVPLPVVQPPIVNPTLVVNPPVVNNVTVVQPVAPSLPTINTQPVQTPSVLPVQPSVPVTPTQYRPFEPISPVVQPMTPPVTQPTIQPETQPTTQPVTQPTTQPVTEPTIQPVIQPVVNPVVQPITQTIAQPVTLSVQPKPVTTTQTKYIVQTETKITKPLPTIEPVVVVPAKVQPIAPASIQPVKVQPVAKPIQTVQPTKIEPVKPAQPITPPVAQPITTPPPVTQPTVQPATPISPQQAQKVVNIIIEKNKQKIPLNVKTTIKQDILNEFETVPLNFRDTRQLEDLTYKHIHKLKSTAQSQA